MTVTTALVTVVTAGTPVQIPVPTIATAISSGRVNSFMVTQLPNQAGQGYIGCSTITGPGGVALNKTTGAGVIYALANAQASWATPGSMPGMNIHNPAEYALDHDTSGSKFLVTYWIY